MSDRDTITLPREVAEEALGALQYMKHCVDNEIPESAITALRKALAAEPTKPSEDIEALRRDAYQGGWLREWLDSNGLLARAIRGESLAGYEHPDIKALRRDAERLREALEKVLAADDDPNDKLTYLRSQTRVVIFDALRREDV